ncbi:MAG: hypothetical protein OEY70_11690 [Acidimicrobiia bacterium]|nr:hypothetical protein [Acidimicrobiia bacterium]
MPMRKRGPSRGRATTGTEWSTPDLYVAVAREMERAAFNYVHIEDNMFVADAYGQTAVANRG